MRNKLTDEIRKKVAFSEKGVHQMSIKDDLKRFGGHFPSDTLELIAGIVAVSKTEGARWQHAQLLPTIEALLEIIEMQRAALKHFTETVDHRAVVASFPMRTVDNARTALAESNSKLEGILKWD